MLGVLHRWGASPAAGITTSAINEPDETMLLDEGGSLTFAEVHRRSNALARGLSARGVREGDGVAIMCRNHHGFVEATLAISKLGASGLYMNTAFAAPQLAEVVERERPVALIYDEEFAGLLAEARDAGQEIGLKRFVAWPEDGAAGDETLEELIEASGPEDLDPPEESGRFVILTSGTTGAPKGAQRAQPDTLGPLAALFSRIPLRAHERTVIAAPLFHSWGFAHFLLGLSLSSTYVLRRRFDPEDTLRVAQQTGATALIVVPVMMQRILELPAETLATYRLPALRITAASGSALPGRAGDPVDGHLRRQPLQPLRVDRGRLGDDRDARGPARGAGHRGPPAPRDRGADRRRRGPRRRAGQDRARVRRERDGLRGLHRRWRKGGARRAAVVGRRRPLRFGRDGCSSTDATTR